MGRAKKQNAGKWIYFLVILGWIIYSGLTFASPITESSVRLGLGDPLVLSLIRLTVVIPYLIIWILAAYGTVRLNAYVSIIRNSPDGKAFFKVEKGLLLLLAGLVIPAIISSIRSFYTGLPETYESLTIILNYMYVVFPLLAFHEIYKGSSSLLNLKNKIQSPNVLQTVGVVLIALVSSVYLWLVFTNPLRTISLDPGTFPTYYLPDLAILVTISIPIISAWIIGVFSIGNLQAFKSKVKGSIYKKSLSNLVWGLGVIIASSIFLQGLLSLGPIRLFEFGLVGILLIVYVFFLLLAIGYLALARGVKKLARIEEV